MLPVLILASSSPRRAELLLQVGLNHQVVTPNIDEAVRDDERTLDYVMRMSREKACFVAAHLLNGKTALNDIPYLYKQLRWKEYLFEK